MTMAPFLLTALSVSVRNNRSVSGVDVGFSAGTMIIAWALSEVRWPSCMAQSNSRVKILIALASTVQFPPLLTRLVAACGLFIFCLRMLPSLRRKRTQCH